MDGPRDRFVPLAQWFAPLAAMDTATEEEPEEAPTRADETPALPLIEHCDVDAGAEVRRFRAALADALEYAVEELLRDIAASVLARELTIAPADVHAIVQQARERYQIDEPFAIRVHPAECAMLQDQPVRMKADPSLRRGDVVLEVACGTIDATLGARLDRVLSRDRPL